MDANVVPTLSERTALQLQELGERRFPLTIDGDATDLADTLKREFSALRGAGGNDLLTKDEGSSRNLTVLCCPLEGYTTAFLKGVVGGAKVYVRPLQQCIGTCTSSTQSG